MKSYWKRRHIKEFKLSLRSKSDENEKKELRMKIAELEATTYILNEVLFERYIYSQL